MSRNPPIFGVPEGPCRLETPDGVLMSDGDYCRAPVYENQPPRPLIPGQFDYGVEVKKER